MADSNDPTPAAFVIMPFDEGFKAVYDQFIEPILKELGFSVSRADTQLNMENILRSIARSLANADLIIADLSIPNENVYYELGLAHALGKPVIMLTEHVDALPFDLRSYRVIPYSTHFAEIEPARQQLRQAASGFLDGTTTFGNPVADFLGRAIEAPRSALAEQPMSTGTDLESEPLTETAKEDLQDDGPGFLDHVLAFEEGMTTIRSAMERITDRTATASESLSSGSEQLTLIREQPPADGSATRQQRLVIMAMAQDMNGYARVLSSENDLYRNAVDQVQPAVEAVLTYQEPNTPEEYEALQETVEVIDDVRSSMQELRDTTENTVAILSDTPNFERSFNRARLNVIAQLRRVIDNTDRVISMLSRAHNIAQERLDTRS